MDFERVAAYIANCPPKGWPYRLLTVDEGLVYRNTLEEVVTIVVSQMIEGKTVVVIPPLFDSSGPDRQPPRGA